MNLNFKNTNAVFKLPNRTVTSLKKLHQIHKSIIYDIPGRENFYFELKVLINKRVVSRHVGCQTETSLSRDFYF